MGVEGAGGNGPGAVTATGVPARPRTGRDGVPAEAARLLVGRLARVAWVPVSVLCATLIAVDAAIRYGAVSRLSLGVPEGWTAATLTGALRQLGLTPGVYAGFGLAIAVVSGIVWFASATLVVWRGWTNPMAGYTAYFLVVFGTTWLFEPERLPAGIRPAVRLLDVLSWTGFVLFFFLFPSGRFAPRWLRWPVPALLAVSVAMQLAAPAEPPGSQIALWLCILAAAAAVQVWRYRAVSGLMERRQTRWLVFGFCGTLLAVLTLFGVAALLPIRPPAAGALVYELAGQALGALLFLPIPLAVVIGMTRHGLWDVDVLVNRALVYGGLSALVVVVYGLAVATGLAVAGGRGLAVSVLTGTLVAVLVNPARAALQRAVNRLMYGERDEPYRLLARLGDRLESIAEPGPLLASIVDTVTEGLRLPYAAIAVFRAGGDRSLAAESGARCAPVVRLPLVHHGMTVGELQVAPRAGEDDLSRADRRVLEDLARPVAVAVRALALSEELQRARERLVVAREEERRRLRRDLHDGLGPVLAAHRLKLGNARTFLIVGDAGAAVRILRELDVELGRSVDAIREMAYHLRPPVLDELGLVEALRAAAAEVPSPPRVSVNIAGAIPDLPAALEVAAYRISGEALANVVRHADAQNCEISLRADAGLTITIADDGRGLPAGPRGVGLTTMRERAEELGGTLAVETGCGGGTRVVAALPFPGGPP